MATKTTKTRMSKAAKERAEKKRRAQEKFRRQLTAVILFAVGIFLLALTFIGGEDNNLWTALHNLLFGLFGMATFFVSPAVLYIAIILALDSEDYPVSRRIWQISILLLLICSAMHIFLIGQPQGSDFWAQAGSLYTEGLKLHSGGLVGGLLGWPLYSMFGKAGSGITVCLLIFVFIMMITGRGLIDLYNSCKKPVKSLEDAYIERAENRGEGISASPRRGKAAIDIDLGPEAELPEHPVVSASKESIEQKIVYKPVENNPFLKKDPETVLSEADQREAMPQVFEEKITPEEDPLYKPEPSEVDIAPPLSDQKFSVNLEEEEGESEPEVLDDLITKAIQALPAEEGRQSPIPAQAFGAPIKNDSEDQITYLKQQQSGAGVYEFPPISLLDPPTDTGEGGNVGEELKANAARLVDTLKSFGVQTRIIDISRGPAVTRYELQPSAGVKISKITSLADDIALNLAAAGVRIEAPIPNKPAVGIEVPNKKISAVNISEIISSPQFEEAKSRLSVALGKDIAGNCTIADIAKMPHVLIAGATGSGKSVCINSIIVSLLYKATPDEVRFLMVDPKVVELGVYNGIPHLLVPVVTDPRKAAGALGWAVSEMLKRYKLFADNSVRDLRGYNELAKTREDLKQLPQIVIIIDELADLMMAAPNEVEDAICRLAQMARAAGMHLVIATQRPSVDVITGIIKANIPSRIAFSVSSQVDSRTILDTGGAEKLLGRGDMLFYPVGAAKPLRVQGCFVSDKEVEKIVDFIKQSQKAEYDDQVLDEIEKQAVKEKGTSGAEEDASDEMLPKAIECVVEAGQASTSLLQRRLKVGYSRAARLIDEMEARGVVGPFEGSKPRQVLITRQQWIEMNMNQPD